MALMKGKTKKTLDAEGPISIRRVPKQLWNDFQAKAEQEGWSVGLLVSRLFTMYLNDQIEVPHKMPMTTNQELS